ncbi:type II secretion system protein [Hydrogenophaga soli]
MRTHFDTAVRGLQSGLTALEMAVVLVVLGLLAWRGVGVLDAAQAQRQREQAKGELQTLRDRLSTYALQNKRLPCPDVNGQGWEGDSTGACDAATTGWVPYRTLGLDLPTQGLRTAYAVFRAPHGTDAQLDADLAVQKERTGNAAGEQAYQDVHDLIRALQNAATQTEAAVLTSQPHVTGNGGGSGAIDCAAHPVANAAFRLIAPLQDQSGDGDRFDSVNGLSALCSQGPDTARTLVNDDVVLIEGFSALSGWLYARSQ